jgi:hypothetical protein
MDEYVLTPPPAPPVPKYSEPPTACTADNSWPWILMPTREDAQMLAPRRRPQANFVALSSPLIVPSFLLAEGETKRRA